MKATIAFANCREKLSNFTFIVHHYWLETKKRNIYIYHKVKCKSITTPSGAANEISRCILCEIFRFSILNLCQ